MVKKVDVKKADLNTKIDKIEKKIPEREKYILTQELSKLVEKKFAERSKQANLASKNYIADFVKKTDFDEKLI